MAKNFLPGTDLFPDQSEWKITNNFVGLADFFFNLNLPPKANKSTFDLTAAAIKISKYRTTLGDLLRPQTTGSGGN